MSSIYRNLIEAVDKGKKFKVDLINKSLWINRKQVIREGVRVDEGQDFIGVDDLRCTMGWEEPLNENPWGWVEFLYQEYKHSVPSEHSNKRSYFKAWTVDELTDDELAFNISRNFGDAMLSGYILLGSLQGWLKWEFGNYWFWQSERDEDLVVIKNWIE